MKPQEHLTKGLLLPELQLQYVKQISPGRYLWIVSQQRKGAVCGRCASLSTSVYDSRVVKVRDRPIHGKRVDLEIKKRRYYCKPCKRPFTEPIAGILPGRKTTQRFRKDIQWACLQFSDLKKVETTYAVSTGFVYHVLYEQLELQNRKQSHREFGEVIGIDEHVFGRKKGFRRKEFVTMVVDHSQRRLREVVLGKTHASLNEQLSDVPGREKVKVVTLDMSDSYKSFSKSFFPNAELVADRFHVERLIQPLLLAKRLEITGNRPTHPMRLLLNRKRKNLDSWDRPKLDQWLNHYPDLKELYSIKEQIGRFYEIRGYDRASLAFDKILERLNRFTHPALKTYTRTLTRWKTEILNFFKFRLTNARVEAFNNIAKVIKRRAYGFRNFKNYRLRLLTACS